MQSTKQRQNEDPTDTDHKNGSFNDTETYIKLNETE